jgi:23S rRNA pseudoU1915 N3-methylase RlmH
MTTRRLQNEGKAMSSAQDLEEAIGEAVQRSAPTIQPTPAEVAPRTETKRQTADRAAGQGLAQECEAIAAEIENTGQTVINIADTISAETEALAELLRRHGAAIGARIEEFMTMSDRVRDKMRAAHDDMVSTSAAEPSLPSE